jgi:hypothetical protein
MTSQPKPYRVLVTGSRDWPKAWMVVFELAEAARDAENWGRGQLTVVHGACPTGADRTARNWVSWVTAPGGNSFPIIEEAHPAEWDLYGKAAGFIRNSQMVALGADLCLAFIKDKSRGATHCASEAYKAGIEVRTQRL